LAWDEKYKEKSFVFKIRNFWSSETYFFHTSEQMSLVEEMCPQITTMLFMFQDRYTCPLTVLSNFKNLTDLELWGGDFYADEFESVLVNTGHNLKRLDLHHF